MRILTGYQRIMAPVYLTKDRVERVIEGLSPSCRREIEVALDSQLELNSGCKREIQRTMSGIAGVDVLEGVSKPMKMHKQPPVGLDPSPPPGFAGQEPNVSNPMFDFFVGLITLIAGIAGMYMLFCRSRKKGIETPKKLIRRANK